MSRFYLKIIGQILFIKLIDKCSTYSYSILPNFKFENAYGILNKFIYSYKLDYLFNRSYSIDILNFFQKNNSHYNINFIYQRISSFKFMYKNLLKFPRRQKKKRRAIFKRNLSLFYYFIKYLLLYLLLYLLKQSFINLQIVKTVLINISKLKNLTNLIKMLKININFFTTKKDIFLFDFFEILKKSKIYLILIYLITYIFNCKRYRKKKSMLKNLTLIILQKQANNFFIYLNKKVIWWFLFEFKMLNFLTFKKRVYLSIIFLLIFVLNKRILFRYLWK